MEIKKRCGSGKQVEMTPLWILEKEAVVFGRGRGWKSSLLIPVVGAAR